MPSFDKLHSVVPGMGNFQTKTRGWGMKASQKRKPRGEPRQQDTSMIEVATQVLSLNPSHII